MMSEWPKLSQEKDSIYLTLVDMFVDVVEPSIIQMVLQNRNWNLDAAIEDVMILSNTTCEKPLNIPSIGTSENNIKVSKAVPHNGLDNFKTNKFIKDDKTERLSFPSSYNTTSKAPVKQDFPAKKKYSAIDCNKYFVQASSDRNEASEMDLSEFTNSYNYVKSLPVPYERGVLLVRNGVKLMIILRGPPGSGKSYLAKKLLSEAGIDQSMHKQHIFSSDDFFIQNNVYVFNPSSLSQAHMSNQHNVLVAIRKHVSPIIVDNTNTQSWEMRVYADSAVSSGYDLEILEPRNWWLFKESELSKRNVHGVPKATIRSMIERYEKNVTPKKLMQQFELQYSLNNAPPQPVLSKWKDKLRSCKSNKPKKKMQEVCPKTQARSSRVNLTSIAPTMTFMPNEFLDSSNLQSTVTCPRSPSVSISNFTSVGNNHFKKTCSPQNPNKTNISTVCDHSKSLFSDENIRPNIANDQVLNKINIPFNSMENSSPHTYTLSSLEDPKYKSFPSNLEEGESNNDSIGFECHQVSFDKTLSKKPLIVLDNFTSSLNINYETLPLAFECDINTQSNKILTPEVSMSNITETREDMNDSELCQPKKIVNISENLHEKELVAKELVNSIIDRVVTTEKPNTINHREGHKMSLKADVKNDIDSLWDYVLVRSDNTFIYKKLNSVPLFPSIEGTPVIPKHTHCQVNGDNYLEWRHEGYCKTECRKVETHNCKENSRSHENQCLDQANVDIRNKPTASWMCSLDSSVKGGNNSNIDSSENNCTTFSSQLIENKYKETKDLKYINPYQDYSLKKHNNVYTTSGSNKEDVNAMGYSTQVNNEKKTEALGIMENILNSMFPCSQKYNTELNKYTGINCNEVEDNDDHMLASCIFSDVSNKKNTDVVSNTLERDTNPKPARKLARLKVSANNENVIMQQQKNDFSNSWNWNTVTNAVEHWDYKDSKTSYELPKEEQVSLPQRFRLKKSVIDSSTNTNYHDFSAVNNDDPAEAKILIGSSRAISTDCHITTPSVSQTLLLDKSTMTIENVSESVNKFDLSEINTLFPHIPESYILDVVEKCQGDIDWAVDLLLDSEHSIYNNHNTFKESSAVISSVDDEGSGNNIFQVNNNFKEISNSKLVCKTPTATIENVELKKAIESSVVFNKSHYSDQVLKVLKKKNPEYLSLIEGRHVELNDSLKSSEHLPTLANEVLHEELLESNASEEESKNDCPDGRHEDDDTLELIVNYDIVFQLQQKFGNSSTPKPMNMMPLVKLPVSLARQLYGYMMDSIQTEIDEHQDAIESMITKDEEIAKILQYQDQNLKPKLQEVMDLEVALAMHKADQEEWKERTNNTVAAKLSKNILLETFPSVDPKTLTDMLHAHNYSLHDTVNSLKLALEVKDDSKQEEGNTTTSLAKLDHNKDVISSYTLASESVDPLNEAQSHRQEAATYYSMRMDCLRKAHEAYRSGNKSVASYYSQLAQMHKQKVEQCNSAAASCLLSTHKSGNTLDLHFLHITEAEVVLDMFLDQIINYISDRRKRYQTVFLITGRGLRSVGGVSRIKPMAIKKLQSRKILYNEVNPGMLSALIHIDTPLSYTS